MALKIPSVVGRAAGKQLTPHMQAALTRLTEYGAFMRYPGGYWTSPRLWELAPGRCWYAADGTIAGLVERGLAQFTETRPGRRRPFPVKVEPIVEGRGNVAVAAKEDA